MCTSYVWGLYQKKKTEWVTSHKKLTAQSSHTVSGPLSHLGAG